MFLRIESWFWLFNEGMNGITDAHIVWLTLSVVIDAILAFFQPSSRVQGFEIQKNEAAICATDRSLC